MPVNRIHRWAAATAGTVVVSACNPGVANVPGAVEYDPSTPNEIVASFEGALDPYSGQSNTTGGGCLIFQDPDVPESCDDDLDCNATIPQTSQRVYGYCISKNNDDRPPFAGSGPKTCWYKPTPSAMVQGYTIPVDPRDPNCLKGKEFFNQSGPVRMEIRTLGNFTPPYKITDMRWRVLTCQNIKPPGCQGGEQNVHRIYRYGRAYEFHEFVQPDPTPVPSG